MGKKTTDIVYLNFDDTFRSRMIDFRSEDKHINSVTLDVDTYVIYTCDELPNNPDKFIRDIQTRFKHRLYNFFLSNNTIYECMYIVDMDMRTRTFIQKHYSKRKTPIYLNLLVTLYIKPEIRIKKLIEMYNDIKIIHDVCVDEFRNIDCFDFFAPKVKKKLGLT